MSTSTPEVTPATTVVAQPSAQTIVDERPALAIDGFLTLAGALVLAGLGCWLAVIGIGVPAPSSGPESPWLLVLGILLVVVAGILSGSLTINQPGQTRVVKFFGRYIGTVRRQGLSMVVPFATRTRVSVRVNNFETNELKVNDADGNPVEIAAIVVWQVADTARASFSVEDYASFVQVQAEAALRHVATTHPYDDPDGNGESLRGSTDVVSAELATEVADRVAVAGVEILEVRISHLAYAPEIAQAMLQRQQANAIVAARSRIVEGAVGMVELALDRLESKQVVELDDERKAAMVSNLLVVLCGESKTTPVVNTGSLYT